MTMIGLAEMTSMPFPSQCVCATTFRQVKCSTIRTSAPSAAAAARSAFSGSLTRRCISCHVRPTRKKQDITIFVFKKKNISLCLLHNVIIRNRFIFGSINLQLKFYNSSRPFTRSVYDLLRECWCCCWRMRHGCLAVRMP